MPNDTSWTRTLRAKLGGITLLILALSFILVAANLYILSTMQGDAASIALSGRGGIWNYEVLLSANRLLNASVETRQKIVPELQEAMVQTERRFSQFRQGDVAAGIPAADDSRILDAMRQREDLWRTQIKPLLTRLIVSAPSFPEAPTLLPELSGPTKRFMDTVDGTVQVFQTISDERLARFRTLQYAFFGLIAVIVGLIFSIARNISTRASVLSDTAERIASGELSISATITGRDELAVLGNTFNTMTANLRKTLEAERTGREKIEELFRTVTETSNNLASASAEILAGTSQQASGAQEQAAAVAQTVSTVNQVLLTSEQAAQRAKAVGEASQRSVEIGKAGRKAVDDSVSVMSMVKEQTESIAESILALAEQAQAIGEITASVNDIAEQTNLLALNAAIEASRAGEQGRGFAVVAGEVKALAGQSKKATAQVRQILGEIQKATNSAVMATEEGTKSVNSAIKVVGQAGETIKTLAETIAEAAQAAAQITASAGQQATGMAQIHQAMTSVNQATHQNLAAAKQTERAAQNLNAMGETLKELLSHHGS